MFDQRQIYTVLVNFGETSTDQIMVSVTILQVKLDYSFKFAEQTSESTTDHKLKEV